MGLCRCCPVRLRQAAKDTKIIIIISNKTPILIRENSEKFDKEEEEVEEVEEIMVFLKLGL
jgi:hypothetical protein